MLRLVREGKCDEILSVGKETDVAQKKDEDADGDKAEAGAEDKATTDKKQAVCTKDGGQVGRIEVGRDNEGVRPALYLAEGSYRIISGSGTLEDPYEIAPAGTEE